MARRTILPLILLAPLAIYGSDGCSDSSNNADGGQGGSSSSAGGDGGSAGGEPVPQPEACQLAGYDATAFDTSGTQFEIGQIVPDFTVNTLTGPFTLSEHWGECSVFTLVPYTNDFNGNDVSDLVERSALNNTYLFYSRTDPAGHMAAVSAAIDGYFATKDEAFQEKWRPRFRYITDVASDNPLLAKANTIQTNYFIIDSRQRFRDAGSFAAFNGDFVPFLPMVRFAADWFNYERRTEEKLAAEQADDSVLIVPWMTVGYEQTDEGRLPIELPSAAEMAKYDRMEIVVKETCTPDARFPVHVGVCPAWDVGHKITLCDDEASCTSNESHQLYRYITGYHSGVWLYEDVSHGLPWFKQGGTRWLRSGRGDFYGTIEFRFFDDGDVPAEEHVSDARHLIGLGTAPFDPAHNDSFNNYTFTPPPGTVKVMIDARVQGGGNHNPTGCAEFCSHTSRADINGQLFEHTFEMNTSSFDCAERAKEGVTSGQFGTWFFDRGSWCPGGPVERWRQDITDAVNLSGSNEIVWTSLYQDNDWPPSGGLTSTVWLVFYGADGQATIEEVQPEVCANPPTVTIRDFPITHPDFQPMQQAWAALADGDPEKEDARGELTGVVAPTLVQVNGEWKPQLIWPENKLPYSTAASFDSWWTDSADSHSTPIDPQLLIRTRQDTAGYFRSNGPKYAASPLLDANFGFGSEGLTFNLDGTPVDINTTFTVEVVGDFVYTPGTRLRLASKADFFVFVDHQLVIESGGAYGHGFAKKTLALDTLGLTAGQSYPLHIFMVGERNGSANPHIWIEHPACN